MATKEFNAKQKEIVARKMGYDGPMSMFDVFLNASPVESRKYGMLKDKFMAKGGAVMRAKNGGMVKKYQEGGLTIGPGFSATPQVIVYGSDGTQYATPAAAEAAGVQNYSMTSPVGGPKVGGDLTLTKDTSSPPPAGGPLPSWLTPPPPMSAVSPTLTTYTNPYTGETYTANTGGYTVNAQPPSTIKGGSVTDPTKGGSVTDPTKPVASQVTPAQIQQATGQTISTELAPAASQTVTAAPAVTAATSTAPAVTPAATMQAQLAATDVEAAAAATQAAQGQVSQQAQIQAAQVIPTQTAVGQLQAAQGVATTVQGAPTRIVQSGELVQGPAVSQQQVEDALAKAEAAKGVVSEDMTVQGQLSKLTANFEAGNPPAWAAASMRNVTAQLAQRGLGASSLAGQALIQATMEAAIPIATADAQVYQQMELQNLSNRQQVSLLAAQQRAQFLGQEFDQTFQTRVVNASRIADIANVNFNAQQQIALENARMAQTMDMTNLSNQQALVMAEAAQIANLEVSNLNNRQQTAVVNAQSFLQMDMTNLANEQQIELFKAQSNVQSILSDQAALNASRQFNASSQNQTDQFFANLTTQVKQFNATQTNAMAQFNTDQTNTIKKFNAETQNQRDQFNASNRLVIDQSNATWRREIATADTAAINRSNEFNATKAMELTTIEYNNMWQRYRDNIEFSWKTSENNAERVNKIVTQEISANGTIMAASINKDAKVAESIGNTAVSLLKDVDLSGSIGDAWDWVSDNVSDAADYLGDLFN